MTNQNSEQTLKRERFHPGIFVLPVVILVFLLFSTIPLALFLKVTSNMFRQFAPQQNTSRLSLIWIIPVLLDLLPALAVFLVIWLAYVNSEITLTNRRLAYRTGFLFRTSGEIPLENVEALFLVEPFLGRMFGYGTVIVSTLGGLRIPLNYLGKPHLFHAALQTAANEAKRNIA